MNNFLRSGSLRILFVLIFLTSVFSVQTQAQIKEILNRIEAHRKALSTLRSDITMGKYDPTMKEWEYNEGKVSLVTKSNKVKQALIRLEWKKPREELILVSNGKYYAYTPKSNQFYSGEASAVGNKGANILSFLTISKAELNADYSPPKYMGEEKLAGNVPTWHLTFIPKAASKFKSADIWADGNGMIIQVKIVAASGDEGYIRLSNFEKNVTLPPSLFKWVRPKGAKEIKG